MHELITINMLYSLKTIFHITPLPPHNGHLSTPPGVEDLSSSTTLSWEQVHRPFRRGWVLSGVLLKVSDRCVPPRVLNPGPF